MEIAGEREGGTSREGGTGTYTLLRVNRLKKIKKIASRKLLCNRELNLVLCDNLEGLNAESGTEVKEGGDIRILMADSRCCTAETSTTLKSN